MNTMKPKRSTQYPSTETGNVWSNWNATQISFTMKWFQYRERSAKLIKRPCQRQRILFTSICGYNSRISYDILVTIHIKLSTFHCRLAFSSFSSIRLLYWTDSFSLGLFDWLKASMNVTKACMHSEQDLFGYNEIEFSYFGDNATLSQYFAFYLFNYVWKFSNSKIVWLKLQLRLHWIALDSSGFAPSTYIHTYTRRHTEDEFSLHELNCVGPVKLWFQSFNNYSTKCFKRIFFGVFQVRSNDATEYCVSIFRQTNMHKWNSKPNQPKTIWSGEPCIPGRLKTLFNW